jgi:hypothetical protein
VDDFDLDDLDPSNTGGKLRERLEETLKANRDLAAEVSNFRAEKAISEGGFKHVSPEDLKGIPADQIAAKAAEVEAAKLGQREAVLKSVLAERGVPEKDLDAAVANLLGDEKSQQAAALSHVLSAGRVGGVIPQLLDPNSLTPDQMISAGLSRKN